MKKTVIHTALGLALGGALLAAPAQAHSPASPYASDVVGSAHMISNHHDTQWRDRRYQGRYNDRYGNRDYRWNDRGQDPRHYEQPRYQTRDHDPYYRDQQVYRDQQAYPHYQQQKVCRKTDGGTGTIIGGAIGALIGREIDKRGDRTLGTVLGAAGGALIGRELEKGRCR